MIQSSDPGFAEVLRLAKEAVESDGGTRFEGDDDDCGTRACCLVRAYKDHEADCWVPRLRAAIARAE